MCTFLKQSVLRKRKCRVGCRATKKKTLYCFHQRCFSWGQKLMSNSVGYFNGLVYLFSYKSISQVLIALLFQAFIFTNGSDKKHGANG